MRKRFNLRDLTTDRHPREQSHIPPILSVRQRDCTSTLHPTGSAQWQASIVGQHRRSYDLPGRLARLQGQRRHIFGVQHALAKALFASALIFAACARSASVTSLRLRDWISGEGREDDGVDAWEEGAEDDADDE